MALLLLLPSSLLLLLSFVLLLALAPGARSLQESVRVELVEALLAESLRQNMAQACQGDRLSLHCPRNTHISPQSSFFGRQLPGEELCPAKAGRPLQEDTGCDFAEAHSRVLELCRAKRKCRLWVRPELFGERDPCPGTEKYLQVDYKCSPVSFEDQNFCQGQQTRLSCKPGQRLSIYAAHYGRTANGQAMDCDLGRGQPVHQDCVADVLPHIARRCHAQPRCSFPVDDRFLGSPCAPGLAKYLSVIFVCLAEEVFSENALRGRLRAMAELDRAMDSVRGNNNSSLTMRTGTVEQRPSPVPAADWHPLLGDNWDEDYGVQEGEDTAEEAEQRPTTDGREGQGQPGRTAEPAQPLPPWEADLLTRIGQVLPWLLMLLCLLLAVLVLSVCLICQIRVARAKEGRERGRRADGRRATNGTSSSSRTGGRLSLESCQPSPGLLDSDGSSHRLLDPFLPPLPSLPSDIYHGCYAPPTVSSGGSCGSGGSAYYGQLGLGPGGRLWLAASEGQKRRQLGSRTMATGGGRPPNLHCYS